MYARRSDVNAARGRWSAFGPAVLVVGLVLGCAPVAAGPRADPTVAPSAIDCPPSVGTGVTCLSVQDEAGAWLIIARPENWNGRLIVHAHGGPRLGDPERLDSLEDLDRFSAMVREGYAWIGSS